MERAPREIEGLVGKYREMDRLREDLQTLENAQKSYSLANSALESRQERMADREGEAAMLLEKDSKKVELAIDEELKEYETLVEERRRLFDGLSAEKERLRLLSENYDSLFRDYTKCEKENKDLQRKVAVSGRRASQLHDKAESRKKKNLLLLQSMKQTIEEGKRIVS